MAPSPVPPTRWRSLPEDYARPPADLDLTDPPVSERRRAAVIVASALAVPVLAVTVSLALGAGGGDGADRPAPRPAAQVAPAPVDTGALGATGVAPGAWVPPAVAVSAGGDVDATGIPARVLQAYRGAEGALASSAPGCHLPWSLVAAIGRVESDHAGGGAVAEDGRTLAPIRGPRLDGTGGHPFLTDTDGGRLDGDPLVDLAVGPLQFLPSSWVTYGADGDADGATDPDDVDDAAVASGRHLCAGGADLADPAQRSAAVFAYNHSDAYVAQVLAIEAAYAAGAPAPELPPSVASSPDALPAPDVLAAPVVPPAAPALGAPTPGVPAVGAPAVGAPSLPSDGTVAPAERPVPSPEVPAPEDSSPGAGPTATTSASPPVASTPAGPTTASPGPPPTSASTPPEPAADTTPPLFGGP
ncbi:lysozyme family protein [Actinomycetospora sp. C-140]